MCVNTAGCSGWLQGLRTMRRLPIDVDWRCESKESFPGEPGKYRGQRKLWGGQISATSCSHSQSFGSCRERSLETTTCTCRIAMLPSEILSARSRRSLLDIHRCPESRRPFWHEMYSTACHGPSRPYQGRYGVVLGVWKSIRKSF
jgi:hypothetical protein